MPEDEVVTEARAAAVARIVPLTEQAESGGKQVTHQHLSIKRFFMAASDMLKQGRNCAAEQDLERAYVLLLRFTTLFLYRLPEHPGFKSAEVAAERKKLKAECMAALDEVEIIKGEIIGRYAAEAEVRIRTEQAEAAAVQAAARVAADEAGRVAALRAAEQAELDEVRAIAAAADAAEAREASVRVAAAAEREAARHAVPTDTGEYDLASELMARCRECASDSDDLLHGDLPSAFLRVVSSNTSRNIETCGILVGTIVKGELRCDRIIIPNQTGSSDTCTTTDEDEIWEYCSRLELCTFGWVHTHPSQTCFLSSVDLHTQCGYQSVLDEAVAIVLSPSHTPSVGAFRLSHPSPPGLAEVQRCRKSGFHPDHQRNGQNAGNGVYEEAAHMRWDPIAPIQVVDMRRNK